MKSALGSVTKRGNGVWQVRVTAGYDPVTGKQKRVSRTVHGSKREAERVKNELLAMAGSGPGAGMSFADYIKGVYLPWHDKKYTRRDATKKLHYVFDKVLEGPLGQMALGELTRVYMVRWAQDNPTWKVDKVRAALSKAVQWELLGRNPLDGVEKERPRPERRRLTLDQLEAVLYAVQGTPIESGVIVQAFCGLRKGEALALDWDDIDFDRRSLEVTRTWHYDKGRGWFEQPKNQSSYGRITIPRVALERLAQIRDSLGPLGRGPIVVSPKTGERMAPNSYSYFWRREVKEVLGEDGYVPVENLRHTHGSLLLDAGASLEDIQQRLRHSTKRTTERYYLRPSEIGEGACADVIDRVFEQGTARPVLPGARGLGKDTGGECANDAHGTCT